MLTAKLEKIFLFKRIFFLAYVIFCRCLILLKIWPFPKQPLRCSRFGALTLTFFFHFRLPFVKSPTVKRNLLRVQVRARNPSRLNPNEKNLRQKQLRLRVETTMTCRIRFERRFQCYSTRYANIAHAILNPGIFVGILDLNVSCNPTLP